MAIISGFTPATVDDIKPFELPTEEIGKGLLARQERSDKNKNAFGVGASALAIDTRANQEDWDLAKKLRTDYSTDIQKIVDSKGGDWSQVDSSEIQSTALKYAQDDRARQLIEAKKQSDLFNEQWKLIEKQNGTPLHFGLNPITDSLYDDKGKIRNFKDWEVQTKLDHIKTASDMFENLGSVLKEKTGFFHNPNLTPEQQNALWYDYWLKTWESKKTNDPQIKAVMDGAYNDYIMTKEGAQYRRQLQQEYKKTDPALDDASIENKVKDHIQNLIAWSGKKRSTTEVKKEITPYFQQKPQEPNYGSGGGSGKGGSGDEEEMPDIAAPQQTVMTVRGNTWLNRTTPGEAADYILNGNSRLDWSSIKTTTNPESIQNLNSLEQFLLGSPEMNPNHGNEAAGMGYYYNIGAMEYGDASGTVSSKKNRSIARGLPIMVPRNAETINLFGNEQRVEDLMTTYLTENDKNTGNGVVCYFKSDLVEAVKRLNPGKKDDFAISEANKILGASNSSQYSSMLDIEYLNDGTVDLKVNQVYYEMKKLFEEDVQNLDQNSPQYKIASMKLKNITSKIQEAESFVEDCENGNHMKAHAKVKEHYRKLKAQAHAFKMIDKTAMITAGIDDVTQQSLEGFNASNWKQDGDAVFMKTKLDAYEPLFNNSYGAVTSGTVYNLFKDNLGDKNTQQLMDAYLHLVDGVANNSLDLKTIEEQAGKHFNKRQGWNHTENVMYYYLMSLMKDNKIDVTKFDQQALNAMRLSLESLGEDGVHLARTTVNGKSELNYTTDVETKKSMYNKNFDESVAENWKGKDQRVLTYFKSLDDAKKNWGYRNDLYFAATESTDQKDLWSTFEGALMPVLLGEGQSEMKIKHLIYNTTGAGSVPALKEEFNAQSFHDLLHGELNRDGQAQDVRELARKNINIMGIMYDPQNAEKNFNVVFQLVHQDKSGQKTYKTFEIEYEPTNSQLVAMGVPAMFTKYGKQVRQQLKENDNLYYDLEPLAQNGTLTRVYVAPYDMRNIGTNGQTIPKGTRFIIGDGNPNNAISSGQVQTFSNEIEVMRWFDKNNSFGANRDVITHYRSIYKELEAAQGDPKKLRFITQKYFGNQFGDQYVTKEQVLAKLQKELEGKNVNFSSPSSELNNSNLVIRTGEGNNTKVKLNVNNFSDFMKLNQNDRLNLIVKSSKNGSDIIKSIEKNGVITDPNNGMTYYNIPGLSELKVNQMKNFKSTSNVRNEYDNQITSFLNEVDSKINFKNPIHIVSGRRSIEENAWAYRHNLYHTTDSRHIRGQAIDIRTEGHGDDSHLGGKEFLNYLQTNEGKQMLKDYGLRALYHKVEGGTYHIDIAVTDNKQQQGKVIFQ